MNSKIFVQILLAIGAGTIAVALNYLRQKSVKLFWATVLLLTVPATVFGLFHYIWHVGFDNLPAYIIGYMWIITITGLLLTSLNRLLTRPWLILILTPILYILGLFLAILIGVNIGLFEPF
jgi:hypothetical protein